MLPLVARPTIHDMTTLSTTSHLEWALTSLNRAPSAASLEERTVIDLPPYAGMTYGDFAHYLAGSAGKRTWMAEILQRDEAEVGGGPGVEITARCGDGHIRRFSFGFAPDGRVRVGPSERVTDAKVDISVAAIAELDDRTRRGLEEVFEHCYLDPDPAYLTGAIERATHISVARQDGHVVAFFTGGTTVVDVPGYGTKVAWLPGLACVAPDVRRKGLMQSLGSVLVPAANPVAPDIGGAKFAHPGSARGVLRSKNNIPRIGVDSPKPLHRTVGRVLAEAVGATDFDDEHFVCIGNGRPLRALVEVDAPVEEWAMFEHVDRSRGDSLLVCTWLKSPPAGW